MIINLQEQRIKRMADQHDPFRTAAALIEHETALYRAKHHKPAIVSDKDRKYAMDDQEAENRRIIEARIRGERK